MLRIGNKEEEIVGDANHESRCNVCFEMRF